MEEVCCLHFDLSLAMAIHSSNSLVMPLLLSAFTNNLPKDICGQSVSREFDTQQVSKYIGARLMGICATSQAQRRIPPDTGILILEYWTVGPSEWKIKIQLMQVNTYSLHESNNGFFINKSELDLCKFRWKKVEKLGIDPNTSRMLSARSTIWATSPRYSKWSL